MGLSGPPERPTRASQDPGRQTTLGDATSTCARPSRHHAPSVDAVVSRYTTGMVSTTTSVDAEGLHLFPLFAGAPEPLVQAMVSGCETRELAAGERLLSAGRENDALYVVLSGSLSVHRPEPHSLSCLFAGDCGASCRCSMDTGCRPCPIADESTLVVAVESELLWWLMEQAPIVARNMLCMLAGRVRNDNRLLRSRRTQTISNCEAATVDALTGLRNRRWLNDAFARGSCNDRSVPVSPSRS